MRDRSPISDFVSDRQTSAAPTDQLPDNIDALKALIADQLTVNEQLQTSQQAVLQTNEALQLRITELEELFNRYASSSEKIAPDQLRLFNEAEVDAADGGLEAADNEQDETENSADDTLATPVVPSKKHTRQKLPDHLPRIDVIHELPESERLCPHDGRLLKEVSTIVSEQLDIVPATVRVIRHIRKQYACDCGHCIQTTPLAPQPIPKSLASPGLLAHVCVSKYQDALPLYRQEAILKRIGIELPRATLANWMIQAGNLIQAVINLLRDRLLAGSYMQMDETTAQVLNETGKAAQSKSYLWLQRGGFEGTLQTDGYAGYNAAVVQYGLAHAGCMAHARRKFSDAVKVQEKQGKGNKQNKAPKPGLAQQGLALIQKLYGVEKHARQFKPEQRHEYRQKHAQPILKEIRDWLDKSLSQVPPKTLAGKALYYLNDEWSKLIVSLQDGRIQIDNNLAENAIRPFVVGRKNWLFSTSVKGVEASANLYSLIETAKANSLEPYAYLRHLFAELPKAQTVEEIEALLLGNIQTEQLSTKYSRFINTTSLHIGPARLTRPNLKCSDIVHRNLVK